MLTSLRNYLKFKPRELRSFRLVILILGISIIIALIYMLSYCLSNNLTESIKLTTDIVRTISTILTLIIALILFDKFGLRKVGVEKQTNAVIKLIEDLRQTCAVINCGKYKYFVWFTSDLNVFKANAVFEKDKIKKIIFKHGENIMIPTGVNDALNNLWIPPTIKDKLKFLDFHMAMVLDSKDIDLSIHAIVEFEKKNQNMYFLKETQTFEEFLIKIQVLMKSLKEWVDKHADIELNLTPTSEKTNSPL